MMLMKNAPRREYRLKDGTLVPGVTTVLDVLAKQGLIQWALNLGREYERDRAINGEYAEELSASKILSLAKDGSAGVGTIAHYKIHCMLTGSHEEYDPKWLTEHIKAAEIPYEKFRSYYALRTRSVLSGRWLQYGSDRAPIFTEHSMVHETLRYGGTPDLLVDTDKGIELWDIKTSKDIYDEYYLQLAGYKMLLDQDPKWRQMKIRPRVVLVTKDGRLEAPYVSVGYMNKARAAWSRLIKFYHEYNSFSKMAKESLAISSSQRVRKAA